MRSRAAVFSGPLGCAAALLLASPSAAQEADELARVCAGAQLPFENPAFETLDDDGDGRITADEAVECAALAAVFSRLDLDADQALSRAELRGFADVWRRRRRTFGDDAVD